MDNLIGKYNSLLKEMDKLINKTNKIIKNLKWYSESYDFIGNFVSNVWRLFISIGTPDYGKYKRLWIYIMMPK